MRVIGVFVGNYKSLADAGEARRATLTAGINVVVGQNNGGKTTLLEAVTLLLKPVQHRSVLTHPHPAAQVPSVPTAEVDFELEEREFLELVADHSP